MSRAIVARLLKSLGNTVLVVALGFAMLFIACLVADPNSSSPLEAAIWAALYSALIYWLVYLLHVLVARKPLSATGFFSRPAKSALIGIGLAVLVFGAVLAANLISGSLRYLGPNTAAERGMGALAVEVAPHLDGSRILDLLATTGNRVGDLVIPDAYQLVLAADGLGL